MYQFLRKVKKMLMRIRAYFLFPFVLIDYLKFKKNDHSKRFKISLKEVLPVLFENIPFTRFDTHYIYHTAWAARKVKEIGAVYHTDISSSLYFSSIVSAFTPVHFYDYRPASLNLSGHTSGSANLSNLHFEDNSINSLSCMHTVEHIGLGRYGDPIDPDGDIQAAKELSRVLAHGGNLLFVVPVGKPRVEFNAHRVYAYKDVVSMFPTLTLKEFSLIPDDALNVGMLYNATKSDSDKQNYGCGCFWFIKK